MAKNLDTVLKFLKGLKNHNDREWFSSHRDDYESAKACFETLVAELIGGIGEFSDVGSATPAECIFRIYRDIRFSPNKLPYKSHMGAVIGPHGKSGIGFGYYVHIQPGGESIIAGGMHMPSSQQLTKFRGAISRDAAGFRKIVERREFKECFGAVAGDKLKTTPQGFSKEHPQIELLRMKEILAIKGWTDAEVSSKDFPGMVIDAAKAMKPFLDYLQKVTR
jgi:uncharacterized protein (TIGR02453 family)